MVVRRQILRLSSHCSAFTLSNIRHFTPLRMTKCAAKYRSWRFHELAFQLLTSHSYDTSRPLETEAPQRDFRVWPNPKRRLACPLRRLPVRPNGPRQRRRIECLGEAQLYAAVRKRMRDDPSFLRVMRAETEGSFLQTGKPWVRERRKKKHQGVVCVRAHACKLRQCNKDPSASLGMTIRGSVWAQMGGAPSFLLGDAQKWLSVTSHQSPVTPTPFSSTLPS